MKIFTTPLKGPYWDFAISGVAHPTWTDDEGWQFPNNMAMVVMVTRTQKPPHGIQLHRLVVRDKDPFSSDIAVAVKDTVVTVTSELSLA